jgi:hypothetical protein
VAQWEYKRAFAVEADRLSWQIFDEAIERAHDPATARSRGSAVTAVEIVNTLSRPRGGLVVLSAERSAARERVSDVGGRSLPSQRLADGSLAIAVREVPGRGRTTLSVTAGRPGRPTGRATASGTTLENEALRVELDPATGAIRSLLDRARGTEVAGPQGLARYRYVAGLDPALARDAPGRSRSPSRRPAPSSPSCGPRAPPPGRGAP